jgi:hypothetical protein
MIASLEDALSSQQEKKKETHEYSPIQHRHPSIHPE